jgi:hypothetical protein
LTPGGGGARSPQHHACWHIPVEPRGQWCDSVGCPLCNVSHTKLSQVNAGSWPPSYAAPLLCPHPPTPTPTPAGIYLLNHGGSGVTQWGALSATFHIQNFHRSTPAAGPLRMLHPFCAPTPPPPPPPLLAYTCWTTRAVV